MSVSYKIMDSISGKRNEQIKEFNLNVILFPVILDSSNNVETDNEKYGLNHIKCCTHNKLVLKNS